jgi:hypothetical protein
MKQKLVDTLTQPATLIALVALVVAMAGTAVAADLIDGHDVENGSLTGKDVKNKSLKPADFSGSVAGPAGPRGAMGPLGPAGPAGPTGPAGAANITYSQKQASTAMDNTSPKELSVSCDPGSKVTGGGFVVATASGSGDAGKTSVSRNYAVDSDSWLVRVYAIPTSTPTFSLTVVADCVTSG